VSLLVTIFFSILPTKWDFIILLLKTRRGGV
jgi:hypothetical protein